MRVFVKGIGWVTPVGCGTGHSASCFPLAAGELVIPTRKDIFVESDKRFGRLDDFSRIGLAAITFCLRDAGLEEWHEKRPIGIVASSRAGCLQTDLAYLDTLLPEQGKLASPNLFAYTLPNCVLGEAALRHGLTGNCLVLGHEDPQLEATLRYAIEELCWSDQCGVLAGFCDVVASGDSPDLGALFILLTKDEGDSGYGVLELNDQQLTFSGQPVKGLAELLCRCLNLNQTDSRHKGTLSGSE